MPTTESSFTDHDIPRTEIPTALQNNTRTNISLHSDELTTAQGIQLAFVFEGKIKIFVHTYNMALLVLGIPGNLLASLVLSRKECQKMLGSIFLSAMTLADLIFVLANQLFGIWVVLTFDLNLALASDWGCKFIAASSNFSSDLSKCSLLAYAFERFLSIIFPLRCRGLISQKLRIRFLIILVTVLILFLIYDMTSLNLTPDRQLCKPSGLEIINNIRYGFSLVFSLFPGIAMIIFNFSITAVLVRRKYDCKHRQNNGQTENTTVSNVNISNLSTIRIYYVSTDFHLLGFMVT